MARPKKNNADYFSHDKEMRNDVKIKYITNEYIVKYSGSDPNTPYAIYNKMLEYLTGCDNFESEWNDSVYMLLSGDFLISKEKLLFIIDECMKVQLLIFENGRISSSGLKKRLKGVLEKRQKDIKRKKQFSTKKPSENRVFHSENEVIHTENEVIPAENAQIKGKEIKEKKKTVSNDTVAFGNADVNAVIDIIKQTLKKHNAAYSPGKQERQRAAILAKRQGEWGKYIAEKGVDHLDAIQKIMTYSLTNKYAKSIGNAVDFHMHWAAVINQMRRDFMEKNRKPKPSNNFI